MLLDHIEGRLAIGGVHVGPSRVLVADLDNRTGKRGAAGADPDLVARAALVGRTWPGALWLQSSLSGGRHAWMFLQEPCDQIALVARARQRLLRVASSAPELYQPFALAGPAGRPGWLELLPLNRGQGATIRAPLGPGSRILDAQGRPMDLSTAQALQFILDHAGGGVGAGVLFPRDALSDLPLPSVRLPIAERRFGGPRAATDIHGLLLACDGRQPAEDRPDRHTYLRVMQWLWEHGLPANSSRHQATFLLGLSCRWDGLDQQAACDRLVQWGRGPARARSKDWSARPAAAAQDTKSIVAHVYRPDAPKRGSSRFKRPACISLGDQLALEILLGRNGRAVDLAVRILCFARTNSLTLPPRRPGDAWRAVCELPMRRLGVVTARDRRAWQAIQDAGVFKLYAWRQAMRPPNHPLGPQRARAARYTIYWSYLDVGRPITARQPIAARVRGYLESQQVVTQQIEDTLRRGLGRVPLEDRAWVEKRWWSKGARVGLRAVGAVGGGVRVPPSKGLWETRSVFRAGVGAQAPEENFEGASMPASGLAASTALFEAGPTRGEGVRGRGESGFELAGKGLVEQHLSAASENLDCVTLPELPRGVVVGRGSGGRGGGDVGVSEVFEVLTAVVLALRRRDWPLWDSPRARSRGA